MATTIQNNHPFNIANVILALSIGILVIVVAVPVLLIFLNSFGLMDNLISPMW